MKALDQFTIAFTGLKAGRHEFHFTVGKSFFEQFPEGEIREGDLTIAVTLDKEERMLQFHFDIRGSILIPCDRCNDPLELPVEGSEELIVKRESVSAPVSGDDGVEIIPESDTRYDLAPFIFETIHLLLPMQRLHPDTPEGESTCNPEALKTLENLSRKEGTDPRWDALKEIKEKD